MQNIQGHKPFFPAINVINETPEISPGVFIVTLGAIRINSHLIDVLLPRVNKTYYIEWDTPPFPEKGARLFKDAARYIHVDSRRICGAIDDLELIPHCYLQDGIEVIACRGRLSFTGPMAGELAIGFQNPSGVVTFTPRCTFLDKNTSGFGDSSVFTSLITFDCLGMGIPEKLNYLYLKSKY